MRKMMLLMMLMVTSWANVMGEEITLQLDSSDPTEGEWAYRNVNNYDQLKVGDEIKATYELVASSNDKQIYFAGPDGGDKFIQETSVTETSYSFTLTSEYLEKIAHGMTLGYKGLKNFKVVAIRNGSTGGGTTDPSEPSSDSYIPSNPAYSVEINQFIANWYGEDNVYRLKVDNASQYIDKVLRVVCDGTGYDAYAFLKQGANWESIMSGADKFSIAGWKYFEITINDALASYLSSETGLIIGGNNYTIQAAYIYDNNKKAEVWSDGDVINSLDLSVDGTSDWSTYGVPGSFFGYKYKDNVKTDATIANTQNNIIRVVLSDAGENAQVSAKDNVEDTDVAYLRDRKSEWDNSANSTKYWYVDYKDCSKASKVDFELSDAITVFKDYQTPVVDATDKMAGVQKGMLSTLLVNGMSVGCKGAKITKIQILVSQVSKYVTGLAIHNHKLSGKYWKPISLPYNLTQEQFKEAFGENAVFCELGKADVTKEVKDNKTIFGMRIHFRPVKGDLNANYPYIICLKDGSEDEKRDFTIQNVKADVRDFQTYTFRTPNFDCSGLTDETERTEYETKLKDAYMNFISTAPVFTIINKGVGDVEYYEKTVKYTDLSPKATDTWYNYAFSSGNIYAVPDDGIFLGSGLAYIQFSSQAKGLIDGTGLLAGSQELSKSYFIIDGYDEDHNTTGIEQVETSASAKLYVGEGVYNMNGQLLRKSSSVDGLPKGMYIIGGKKVIIK